MSLPKQRRRRRRKVEIEAERAAKRRNLMDMVAQLRESHAAESQSQAMDLTKAQSLELGINTTFRNENYASLFTTALYHF